MANAQHVKIEDIDAILCALRVTSDSPGLILAEGNDPRNGPGKVESRDCRPYSSLELAGVIWRKIKIATKPTEIAKKKWGARLLCREREKHSDGSGTTCRDIMVIRTGPGLFKAWHVNHNPEWFSCCPLAGELPPPPPQAYHNPPASQAAAVVEFHTRILLSKADWSEMDTSARCLGDMGKEAANAVPALVQALDHHSAAVQEAAASALAQIGPGARAIPILVKMLAEHKDSDSMLRNSIIRALGQCGREAKDAVPILRTFLNHGGYCGICAKEALGKIDPELLEGAMAEINRSRKIAVEKAAQVPRSFMSCDLCGRTLDQEEPSLFAKNAVVIAPNGQQWSANALFKTAQATGKEFKGVLCIKCSKLMCYDCYKQYGSQCLFCGDSMDLKVALESIVREHLPQKLLRSAPVTKYGKAPQDSPASAE